jgi:FkbM family methyltransferase
MWSKITRQLYFLSKAVKKPTLLKLKLKGGLTETYEKLDTHWFKSLNIDTVLDIGANTGQFTKMIVALLADAKIYSFEPLPDCFEQLQKFSHGNSNITVFNLGIGDRSGNLSFERNASSASSSFLKMTNIHKEAFPFTKENITVEVEIAKLDDIRENLEIGNSLLIKIDVQGYEDKVLHGGEMTIKEARMVIVETSFVTLYESQPFFSDIYSIFQMWGFSYVGMLDQLVDPNTGEILQGDAIFVKQS